MLHQLEKVKAIPIYLKKTDGTDGIRARLSYQKFSNLVLAAYSIILFVTFVVNIISNTNDFLHFYMG